MLVFQACKSKWNTESYYIHWQQPKIKTVYKPLHPTFSIKLPSYSTPDHTSTYYSTNNARWSGAIWELAIHTFNVTSRLPGPNIERANYFSYTHPKVEARNSIMLQQQRGMSTSWWTLPATGDIHHHQKLLHHRKHIPYTCHTWI